jgi:hypothetical protein
MWGTRLFVLPFVLLSWIYDGIRYLIRQHQLNSEVYLGDGVEFRRRDRIVTVPPPLHDSIERIVSPKDAGRRGDLVLTPGQTGTVRCGMGTGSGWLMVNWDAQDWKEKDTGNWVRVAAFHSDVPMEELEKV